VSAGERPDPHNLIHTAQAIASLDFAISSSRTLTIAPPSIGQFRHSSSAQWVYLEEKEKPELGDEDSLSGPTKKRKIKNGKNGEAICQLTILLQEKW
jgi:hypothetical protein